ncbi:MAG: hypothetical protein G8237_14055 [Magnetococcales bacterium]|nr:hypothetical protein [Magnetococcales bacterium]NGZ07466.1 hypothetical protein [Magnetococcales bacterium]
MSESSTSVGEIIKADAGAGEFRRIGIQELLAAPQSGKGEHFLRFRPDGRLPVVTPPKKEPEITPAELQARRMEQMEREVYQRVFAAAESAGLKAGEERMEREIQALIPRIEGMMANLEQLHVRILASAERYLVETCLVVVRELLASEMTVNPEIIAARVKRILTRAAGRKGLVVRVTPGNAQVLARMRCFANLRIEADDLLSPGAVHLESDFGGLEDNLELQLKEVELSMREYLQERLDAIGEEDIAAWAKDAAAVAAARMPHPLAPDPGSEPARERRAARSAMSAVREEDWESQSADSWSESDDNGEAVEISAAADGMFAEAS